MIVPDDGELAALLSLLGPLGANVTVRLWKNDFSPDRFSTFASFTQCDFTDYTPLNTDGWTVPAVDSSGVAFGISPVQSWTVTTPTVGNTAYGIYATVFIGGVHRVIAAERFAVAVPMALAGQSVARQITYTSRRAA